MVQSERGRSLAVIAWSLGGIAAGIGFILLAWWIGVRDLGGASIGEVHAEMPVMWVVDLAPSVLGMLGLLIGTLYERNRAALASTRTLAGDLATAWTSDLRRTNAELADAVADRESFYASLSHELRTPLASILGYSEMAEGLDIHPTEVGEYLTEIVNSASFLLDIVNDLLEAAKLSRQGMRVTIEDIDGNAVVGDVAHLLRPLADAKGLTLVTKFCVEPMCRADAVRLRQVVTNLVANAVKYSDEGTITVRTSCESGSFIVEVVDQGSGLAASDLERIFQPFEVTDTTRHDATGLGLAVSRSLTESMHGTLTAASDGLGTGSAFRLVLPVATGEGTEVGEARLTGATR